MHTFEDALRRAAGIGLGWVRRGVDLEPRGTDIGVDRLLPGSVRHHLLECRVDLSAQLGVALLQTNAVPLGRERLTDNLELARVLRLCSEAGQDHVVGSHRIYGTAD